MKQALSHPPWINPLFIAMAWSIVALLAWMTPESTYLTLMRAPKYIDAAALLIAVTMLGAFALGAFGGMSITPKRPKRPDALERTIRFLARPALIRIMLCFYVLTLLAYLLAFGPSFSLAALLSRLSAETYSARLDTRLAGLTTMTQFGVLVVTHASLLLFSRVALPRRTRRLMKLMIWSLILLVSYRSLIWSERLALIETLVPIAVVYVVFNIRSRLVLVLMLPLGLAAAVLTFGFFEYFRSWTFYREHFDNLAIFSFQRLMGYYSSSFNNFGMAIAHLEPTWQPIWTLDFLYKFPIPGNPLLAIKAEAGRLLFQDALELYAHPEFNLYSGPGFIYLDFGWIGGSLVLFILGLITGRLYNAFRRCSVHGLLVYPIWVVGLIDFGRIVYWTQSRAFPIWLGALLILYLYSRYCERRPASDAPRMPSKALAAPSQA